MKKKMLLAWVGMGLASGVAVAQTVTGPAGTLTVDEKGLSLTPAVAECPKIAGAGGPLWRINLEKEAGPGQKAERFGLHSFGKKARAETLPDGFRLTYGPFKGPDGAPLELSLAMEFRSKGDVFEISGEIRNNARGWRVIGFSRPTFLENVMTDLAAHPLLLPNGYGTRLVRAPADLKKGLWPWTKDGEKQFRLDLRTYPANGCSMPWCAFAGERGGLYIGQHDPDPAMMGCPAFVPGYFPEEKRLRLGLENGACCLPGGTWRSPVTVLAPYRGTWHVAARRYRAWYDSVRPPVLAIPAWPRDMSGWLLAILKQQNGEIMWPYGSLGKLCDVADARGLDMIGLFGWAAGGHDHLYPDYIPDPKMGGEKTLRAAVKEIRGRGKRVILYANGQLMEREATEFWKTVGKNIAVTRADGATEQQTYHKYSDIPAYRFEVGCTCAQAWYGKMLELARQANDFGADGILFDQLATGAPRVCYGAGHGHPVPWTIRTGELNAFVRRIAETMRKENPDFIVMTEGIKDCVLDSVAMFHGYERGLFRGDADDVAKDNGWCGDLAFPELFRYTFPEVLTTVRVPAPMMDRRMANFTFTYGLRYELESRYVPDVAYLLENKMPSESDYGTVIEKPSLKMVRGTPPEAARDYLKRIIDFQRGHAELFWKGRFTDTEGFSVAGDGVVAKGFDAGKRFGVAVWNPGKDPAAFKVSVPGAVGVSASEPEAGDVKADAPLAPETVRLLVWEKK